MALLEDPDQHSASDQHAAWWDWSRDMLGPLTAVVLGTLCALAVIVPAAVGRLADAGCTLHGPDQPAGEAARWQQEAPDNATFAICVIMKVPVDDPQWVNGRAEDVHEWLDYHKAIGVGRVYVIDHLSEVPLNKTLRGDIASGYVSYEYSTMPGGPQLHHYRQCLLNYGARHRYMAFIDNNEFLALTDKRPGAPSTLPEFMDRYDAIRPFGGFVVASVVFDSSGHIARPKGGILHNYWRCQDRNVIHSRHVKTIVNTAYAGEPVNPHEWTYTEPFFAIDERFDRADGPIMPEGRASVDKIGLHHYLLKSLEDFESKVRRGGGDGTHKAMDTFKWVEDTATENCTALLRTTLGAPRLSWSKLAGRR